MTRRAPALVLAALGGGLHALALAWPFAWAPPGISPGQPVWWLQVLSLVLLAGLLQRAPTWPQAALRGWLFALAMLTGTFWWLYISMHTYGGLAAPLTVAAVLGLAGFLAVYYGVAGAVYGALFARRRVHPLWAAVLFAALWTLAELLRGHWFTGFPWGASGYAHLDGPLATWPRYVGVYGTGAVAALLSASLLALLGALAQPRGWLAPAAAVLALGAVSWALPGPAEPLARTGPIVAGPPPGSAGWLDVTLLQGNIPQDEKFQPGKGVPDALDWYGRQLMAADSSLVVGPETAVPLLPGDLPPGYWDMLQNRFAKGDGAALLGIPLGNLEAGYTNSVVGLKPGQPAVYEYAKHHLVPFGEFIPLGFRWFTELMHIPLGDFNRGAVGQPSFDWQGQRLAPNICYEDLFGEELGARFRNPAAAPTIFVNVSNIGWFGDSVAIDQHLHISRMRAREFERPFVRATNTGATVVIDHLGRVTHALPRLTRDVLVGTVEGRTVTTPFAWWVSRFGLVPLWLLALGLVAVAFLVRGLRLPR